MLPPPNGTGQAGDVVGVKVPASCLAATCCMEVADLNLGAYRRRTIVRCWRSSYARACRHFGGTVKSRVRAQSGLVLAARGGCLSSCTQRGRFGGPTAPRVWPSQAIPSGVPPNQDPAGQRRSRSARAIARCASGRRRKPSASRASRLLKSCRGAQPCLPPCAHKPAQCRRLPATDMVLTFPVSPMLRAHIHACAPAVAHGDALGSARARAKCAPGASKSRTRGFYSSRARHRQMTGEGSKIASPGV